MAITARAERFNPTSGVIEEYRDFETISDMVTFAIVENTKSRNVGYSPEWQVTVLDEATDETYGVMPMGSPWCP